MRNTEETTKTSLQTSVSRDTPNENVQIKDPIMNDEARLVLDIIFFVAVNGIISVLGSAANVINIVIFIKQGYNDPINIKFIGLAVSDLGALIALLWQSICFNPLFRYSNIEFDSVAIQYITAGMPRGWFVLVTSWITAFITFERCVCIALPLKVKDIITPTRTLITVAAIFLIMFASISLVFYSVHFAPSFNPERNQTLIRPVYSGDAGILQDISFSITVVEHLSSFIFVIVCTSVLIYNLIIKSQWRNKVTNVSSSNKTDSVSTRDKKVMKMATLISSTFIACYLPSAVNLIFMVHFSAEYSSHGRYQNSFHVSWAVVNTLEAINSFITIFVYYNTSSKFKSGFHDLFGTCMEAIRNKQGTNDKNFLMT